MKHKKILTIYALCLAVALLTRCLQLFFITMENTGFFMNEYQLAGTLMSLFIFAVIFLPFMLACFARRCPSCAPEVSRSISVAAFLLAGSILYEIFVLKVPAVVPELLVSAEKVTGIAACAVLVWLGCLGLVKGLPFRRGFTILIVLYFFMRLVVSFSSYSSISNVSDNVFDIFMLCATLVFFLYFAKVYCLISPEKSCFRVLPISFLAFSFTALNTIPKLLLLCAGKPALDHDTPSCLITNIAMGVFIAVFTLRLFSKNNLPVKRRSTRIIDDSVLPVSDKSFLVKPYKEDPKK